MVCMWWPQPGVLVLLEIGLIELLQLDFDEASSSPLRVLDLG